MPTENKYSKWTEKVFILDNYISVYQLQYLNWNRKIITRFSCLAFKLMVKKFTKVAFKLGTRTWASKSLLHRYVPKTWEMADLFIQGHDEAHLPHCHPSLGSHDHTHLAQATCQQQLDGCKASNYLEFPLGLHQSVHFRELQPGWNIVIKLYSTQSQRFEYHELSLQETTSTATTKN